MFVEAVRVENIEHRVPVAEHSVDDYPGDRRSDHETVAAESARHVQPLPVADRPEHGLVVRRHVVDTRDEEREGNELEAGKKATNAAADRRLPARASLRRVTTSSEIARQHTPVRQLLRRERKLWRHDQRIE